MSHKQLRGPDQPTPNSRLLIRWPWLLLLVVFAAYWGYVQRVRPALGPDIRRHPSRIAIDRSGSGMAQSPRDALNTGIASWRAGRIERRNADVKAILICA